MLRRPPRSTRTATLFSNRTLCRSLRANGAVVPPLIILFLSMFPIRLGFYWLTYPALGGDAIWWSFPLSSTASLAMALAVYRRGHWWRALQQPEIGSASCWVRVLETV